MQGLRRNGKGHLFFACDFFGELELYQGFSTSLKNQDKPYIKINISKFEVV